MHILSAHARAHLDTPVDTRDVVADESAAGLASALPETRDIRETLELLERFHPGMIAAVLGV